MGKSASLEKQAESHKPEPPVGKLVLFVGVEVGVFLEKERQSMTLESQYSSCPVGIEEPHNIQPKVSL
jgi:hypothetical protein